MDINQTISLGFGDSAEDQTLLRRICSSSQDEDRTHVEQVKHLLEMALGIKPPDMPMWRRLRPHQVAEYLREQEELRNHERMRQEQAANQN